MKTILCLIIVVAMAVSCATVAQIPQDKPATPEQCFEGKFNIYRIADWEHHMTLGNIYIFKNPKIGELPDYVATVLHPTYGVIMKYAYLDGQEVMAYTHNGDKCYVREVLPPEQAEQVKKVLLKMRNGHEV